MNLRLRRRRFGQLAIASAATAAIAKLAGKTMAQQPQLVIYGVRVAPASRGITANLVDTAAANTTPAIVLETLNLATGLLLSTSQLPAIAVGNKQEPTQTVAQALIIKKPSERITGLTTLSDGTLVIAAVAASKQGDFSRLIFFGQDSIRSLTRGLKVETIRKNSTVESLLAIKDNQLLSVVSLNQGTPPFDLAVINPASGQVDSGAQLGLPDLQSNRRFSNLARSPKGTIYATTLGSEGVTTLVQLDLANKSIITGRGKIIRVAQLSFKNRPLENDLASLAFSSSGQLFALGDPTYQGTNSLFTVDVKTGVMTLLRQFAVDKIAFNLL